MLWLILPLALLFFGSLGLVLNVRSYRKGESVSVRKVATAGLFVVLAIGVFLQGFGVIDMPQLRGLLLAFGG